MKITDGLLEGKDKSLEKKKRLILTSSSSVLEDILHVICVYVKDPSISLKQGVLTVRGTEGQYDFDKNSYLDFSLCLDIASKEITFMMIGSDNSKFSEFTLNLLKIKGMREIEYDRT